MSLRKYHQKRDFSKTTEPSGKVQHRSRHRFYMQKHAASHLHYDLRLELDGVLKSWAVPKGPSLDPRVKRLAMHVEDHPIEYGTFEGIIPKGEYGGGTVLLWDKGCWKPLDKDPQKAYEQGHLRFELEAEKLQGRWDLIHFKKEANAWFLVKYADAYARTAEDITTEELSVLSGKSMQEIAEDYDAIWSKQELKKTAKKKVTLNLPITPMPNSITPQLAKLMSRPPAGDDWLHEVKWDGYRILAFKDGNRVRLFSRSQNDWTATFPSVVDAIKKIPVKQAIFDGELILLDENNRSNFQLLQNAIKSNLKPAFIYYVFDLLYYQKWDIRSLTLLQRKALLKPLLTDESVVRFSDHIVGQGDRVFQRSCESKLEGIISKISDSSYFAGRSASWIKSKCVQRQEFVIGGFTLPKNSRSCFGSLFTGVYDAQKNLVFSGNVGTGFTEKSLQQIYAELKKRIITKNPFNSSPPGSRTATWVKPQLVAEIEFTQWTEDGHLRHPSFKGLRWDKKASDVIRETAEKKDTVMKLTHSEKVLYKEDDISKQDLFDYYDRIATHILPYIINRPLTLVRCPSTYQDCFYQKKINNFSSQYLHPIPVTNKKNETEDYIYLNNKEGLLTLVQLGVLEIHPWGSRIETLDYPDMMIFDLDPAPELSWKNIVAAAFAVKHYLQELKLKSFVKTTGGKGLHVVVPIVPEYDWEDVKNFTHVFAQFLEKKHPDQYVSNMSKVKRRGKIFVDYLRNQHGATSIAAYSTRARMHAPVSLPLDWDELTDNIEDTLFTIATVPQRLDRLKADPWALFWKTRQQLKLPDL